MKTIQQDNGVFRFADAFVNQTGSNVFLTGKAGTGKTTFLQHVKENTFKNSVVVAPTGVAAINAGGMTIHSFFQLPIGTFIPERRTNNFQDSSRGIYSHGDLFRKTRINTQKRQLIQELELLIIDEVSMVRADVMDAIDAVLRHIRGHQAQPFGGVQVLMIGDLYQLPPVVVNEDKEILAAWYDSPYFFSSQVIKKYPPVWLELDKIYRQSDEKFIGLLNKIRNNEITDEDLDWLNSFYKPEFRPGSSENFITLCSHHYKANAINERELKNLPGKTYSYEAATEGEFNSNAAPADQTLLLKKGAQIMFIRNDKGESKRYFNGKIGIINDLDQKKIKVSFPDEPGEFTLEREEWKNIRYSYDNDTRSIVENELGSFRQFPVKLAWAITIHKSQGLTFDHAIIDAGDSFTSGQVYVALSRLRNTDGLILRTPIKRASIISDVQVIGQNRLAGEDQLTELLKSEQEKYIGKILFRSMDWEKLTGIFRDFREHYRERKVAHSKDAVELANDCLNRLSELTDVAGKFRGQLSKLIEAGEEGYGKLSERLGSAHEYFRANLEKQVENPIKEHFDEMGKKPRMQKYLKALLLLRHEIRKRLNEIRQARDLAEGLAKGQNISGLLNDITDRSKDEDATLPPVPKPVKPKRGDSSKVSFEMFKAGKSIDEIAAERSLAKSTIETHMLLSIKEGMLDVYEFVPRKKYEVIKEALLGKSFDSLSELKYLLNDEYSYNEIRAVMNHIRMEHEKNAEGK